MGNPSVKIRTTDMVCQLQIWELSRSQCFPLPKRVTRSGHQAMPGHGAGRSECVSTLEVADLEAISDLDNC